MNVRVLLSFQQPTFQKFTNINVFVQLHGVFYLNRVLIMIVSSEHLNCGLLKVLLDLPMNDTILGGPQGSFFLCAVSGTKQLQNLSGSQLSAVRTLCVQISRTMAQGESLVQHYLSNTCYLQRWPTI